MRKTHWYNTIHQPGIHQAAPHVYERPGTSPRDSWVTVSDVSRASQSQAAKLPAGSSLSIQLQGTATLRTKLAHWSDRSVPMEE